MTKQFSYEEALKRLRSAVAGKSARVDPEYAGRFMFGKSCLAVAFDAEADLMAVMLDVGSEEPALAKALSQCIRRDELGKGSVAYFPAFERPRAQSGDRP